jgi:hypothetical protein
MPLLKSHGVAWIDPPKLSVARRRAASEFATQDIMTIDDISKLFYRGAPLGMGVASSVISQLYDPAPDVAKFKGLIARNLKASAMVFEFASALIREHRPKAVLVFNGRFACSKPIVEAARQLKVECLFYERGATFERYIVQQNPIHDLAFQRRCIAETWTQAGPERAEVGRSFFARSREGDGIGEQSYTGDQIRGVVPPRRLGRRIVYFYSSDDEYAAVETVQPHTCFRSQRQAIEFLVDWTRRQPDVELVVRLHPNIKGKPESDPHYWDSLQGHGVTVDPPDSKTDSYALAESADLVLTWWSTMGIEAAFAGKPVILLSDSPYRGIDCVYEPHTLDEVVALLGQRGLPPKPPENCLPYGFYAVTFGTRYRFYQPGSLYEGLFMGVKLTMEPEYLHRFRMSSLGRRLRHARAKVRRFVS